MVARLESKFRNRKFSESWIVGVPAKANSPQNEKKMIDAKFYPAFLKGKHSERLSQFLFGTKMPDPKTTRKLPANSGRRMPIILTKLNMESETGRGAVAPLRVKRSVELLRVRLPGRSWRSFTRSSNSSRT